jgi:hypothetical protein
MRKTPTGEPCAGEPHARFGGRGGLCLSLPLSVVLSIVMPDNVPGRKKKYNLETSILFLTGIFRIYGRMGPWERKI